MKKVAFCLRGAVSKQEQFLKFNSLYEEGEYVDFIKCRNSVTYIYSYKGLFSDKNPIFFFTYFSFFKLSFPLIKIVPELCLVNEQIIFINVDFPAPFGPKKPTISPLFKLKLILSRTNLLLYDFEIFFTLISIIIN